MSAVGMSTMVWLIVTRAVASRLNVPVAMCFIIAASLLQLCFIRWCNSLYRGIRHQLTYTNRFVRLLILLGPVVNGKGDVISRLMPTHHLSQPELVLLGAVCIVPIMHFYGSLCFVVSAASLLLVQAPYAVITTKLYLYSQEALLGLPGMQQLADSTCVHVRGMFELLLHVFVDQGTMPAVPAAGFDAFGTTGTCSGHASFLQLMLYGILPSTHAVRLLTYLFPVYLTYSVEMRHKLRFWQLRGVYVTVQASPLLPFPDSQFVSHCCVLLCSQVLLWFLAEVLTGLLT
jgi:hypothetical protein